MIKSIFKLFVLAFIKVVRIVQKFHRWLRLFYVNLECDTPNS